MSWDYSTNGRMPQKKYNEGRMLVRKMGEYYWVLNLGAFAGLIVLETKDIRKAIRFAKNPENVRKYYQEN